MPIFEFKCHDCGQQFEVLISNADKNKIKCPECSSGQVKQLLSLFSTGGGRSTPSTASNCDTCGVSSG